VFDEYHTAMLPYQTKIVMVGSDRAQVQRLCMRPAHVIEHGRVIGDFVETFGCKMPRKH
jgi:hypothetical protein